MPPEIVKVTVDTVSFTIQQDTLEVLLIKRKHDPFKAHWALPGGFLRDDEDLTTAAERELAEETGLDGSTLHLEQLATYGTPDRDPRGRVVTVAYLAIAPDLPIPAAGSDASAARWVPVDEVRGTLAFDHAQILDDAVERARTHLELTTLATAFCAATFTMGDLRHVYEVVWGRPLDPRNFSRKVGSTQGFVQPAGGMRAPETGRPAALYRRGPARVLNPPLLRNSSMAPGAARAS
jgi:8-oxo-dGTP diphosphatase